MSNRIIAIGLGVLLAIVSCGLGFMIVKSTKRDAAPVATVAVKEEVKAVVEPVKPVAEVKAMVVEPKPKAKPVELTFTEAKKLAIALLKKNADAEWALQGGKLTAQERMEMSAWIGNDGAIPTVLLDDALHFKHAIMLRDAGLPKSALYAVGTCALNDMTTKPLFEIVWAKKPNFRSVEQLAEAAGRVSFMSRSFMQPAGIVSSGSFFPDGLLGEWRRDIEYVFGVETSTFVR